MYKLILTKIILITGILCVLYGYYLLWVPAHAEFSEVVTRTRIAIILTLAGNVMILLYMYRKSR